MQFGDVARDPAAPHREPVARQAGLQLTQHAVTGPGGDLLVAAGHEDDDLRRRGVAVRVRGQRAGHDGPRPALDGRQHPGSPARPRWAPGSGPARRARWRRRPGRCPGLRPGRRVASRSVTVPARTACRNVVAASCDARSGARSRSTSEATSVVTSRTSAVAGSRGPRSRSSPTTSSATRSSMVRTPRARSTSARSSADERAATARIAPAAVEDDEAHLQGLCRSADDLGQAGARLDRVGDRTERLQVACRGGFGPVGLGGSADLLRREGHERPSVGARGRIRLLAPGITPLSGPSSRRRRHPRARRARAGSRARRA